MRRHVLTLCAACALAVGLTGCGIANPYATSAPKNFQKGDIGKPAVRTGTDSDPAPERGGTIPARTKQAEDKLTTGGAHASAQAALEQYALSYVNWTAKTVAQIQRRLAGVSLGSARASALQAAATYGPDTTLRKSDIANSGTVISIARGQGAASDWVVVTRETTTGRGDYQGLPTQLHITFAQLTHTKTGWVVSTWSPQT